MNLLGVVYIIIIVCNILCVIEGRKNNIITIVSAMFMVLFAAGIEYNGSVVGYDLRNYEILYENTTLISRFEFGFRLINELCKIIGLTFTQFHFVVVAGSLISIFCVARKMGANLNLIIVAYMIYFILPVSGQMKNLCAMAVLVHIFPTTNNQSKKANVKEFFVVCIAATIHVSFLLYLIFLLIHSSLLNSRRSTFYKSFFGIVSLMSLILIIFRQNVMMTSMFNAFISLLGTEVNTIYSPRYSTVTGFSPLASLMILTIAIVAIVYWRKRVFNEEVLLYLQIKDDSIYELEARNSFLTFDKSKGIFDILMLSAFFFPLVIVNATFYRLIRDVTLIAILHLGVNCYRDYICKRKRIMIVFFVFSICLG